MEEIIVYGDNPLKGTVEIEGAKNAVLPILAASLLAEEGTTKFNSVPILSDVFTMKEVIHHLNAKVDFDLDKKEITVDASYPLEIEAPYEYVSKMRASIVVLGPLLARNGHAKVAMPGGCAIGKRPIDLHLKGFQALGATIHQKNGYIEAVADQLEGNSIYLDFPSVGATQNIMMAAVKARGTTTIDNVAREPEIVDLANVLNKMGAKIHGAGTEIMRIEGVEQLHAVSHAIVQDRIEAGTFMVAGAMPNNDVFIKDAIAEHNRPLLSKIKEMGAEVTETEEGIRVQGPSQLQPTDIKTLPHPGFPTDMQAQTSVLQLLANGTSVTTETVFENRFQHLEEMCKMNAHMKIDGNVAIMQGNDSLQGALVYATDLRAAAALVLAGLKAEGITRVRNLKYLDRGYYQFHEKLQKLGANIERVNDNPVKEEVQV
ncbi:UDP-N-acetylglucosamine 1-carboxyvinyltransferase [Tetragenococcus halophilus subsp. halophilus]|uniref:UDP-N-acetylglucosamine 1-carboxyvinyltransferase n=1 Tax=Tetragenococcus halophilus TaxID=51669 RepID=A0A3G5FKU9_TETHA|nr:UDP-N-acetylglucosamine 1-carboxyvinyltransferase [Tetragenococcus halophilus]AOF49139.1 UDP-N-acetylglucosamine 1-carboxyvinyltransferase [Tetragenococcus halophilus]AYW50758.1 UDP-N-acetylglucosamine 1-carboxyvinyltransferase [Tetragenococcus halophilus]MCF1602066.1 UDP-N-acetylglucosamine 1-carboxyvinyltransferase [Tetragenococcus halophilus]MCO8286118.1 UDP-N-acetylglucosamine 1-carboxyvinyltransferase [Tetragenococcus halophilus]MCO8292717.1 UDP-N-acetylglucosamine 1-carboxyvinyltransf